MEGLELICFNIISSVGMAKSSYVEAMRAAAKGDYQLSGEKMKEGDEFYSKGHDAHLELLSKEANGEDLGNGVILMHAEDQMMAAEVVRLMAEENIKMSKKIQALENKSA
ncbi:MAG TPA: PTS lactose/cellobiose transporter subunit IIA [Candidatus Lachnoclostridium stercorigallinarum]|mgnify:FL=1|uniref:PTS lactose/cellobiose transporter subunit IIA n=1 Tax=Candidatus Lachnoclostridium stercorigallinarum TaxID=2838634 RepID=A0A9D2GHG7_9FIRM|nr:PTS lactose/cellobiose transporter subunit IIA [Candidatus Lachnoclostridium stercorigallinarum]